jgi:hypothetical protein
MIITVKDEKNKFQGFRCECGNQDPLQFNKYIHHQIEMVDKYKVRVPRRGLACSMCNAVITQTEIEEALDK